MADRNVLIERYKVLLQIAANGVEFKEAFSHLRDEWLKSEKGINSIRLLVSQRNQRDRKCYVAFEFKDNRAFEAALHEGWWTPNVILKLRHSDGVNVLGVEENAADPRGFTEMK